MLVGFLFKSKSITYVDAFLYIGIGVAVVGAIVFLVHLVVDKQKEVITMGEGEKMLKRA
jgi:NNP family nitrate/nitrite transporter-like MFS transporter